MLSLIYRFIFFLIFGLNTTSIVRGMNSKASSKYPDSFCPFEQRIYQNLQFPTIYITVSKHFQKTLLPSPIITLVRWLYIKFFLMKGGEHPCIVVDLFPEPNRNPKKLLRIPKFGNTEILGRFRVLKSRLERDWFGIQALDFDSRS